MKRKQYASTALIVIFCVQILFAAVSVAPFLNKEDLNSESSNPIDTPLDIPSASETASTWWNDSFTHRIQITVQEPNTYQRENTPVETFLEFEPGLHRIDSTRLVKYTSGTWTPQSFQLRDVQDDGTFIHNFTIIFLVSINLNESQDYYVYFSDELGIPAYTQSTSLDSNLVGSTLTVDNGHYELELAEGEAIYQYEYAGTNYHTENSFMPLSTVLFSDSSTYAPDSNGFLRDWLVVGPFNEPSQWSQYASVYDQTHIDVTKDYSAGDFATPGNSSNIDPTRQWEVYNSPDLRIDFEDIYGGNERSAYGLVYVYAPSDLVDIYLKLASDDGIIVIMDHHTEIFASHSLQALGSSDRWASPAFTMTQGWHSFLVLCEEDGGDWRFTMRFSTDNVRRTFSDNTNVITNLTTSLIPQTEITQITPEVVGPIYSQYNLNWSTSQDMTTYDTITFYDKLNMWKCERTFYWSQYHVSPDNSSFSALNTYYTTTDFEEILYDNQRTFGLTNEITAQDYTFIRDFNGGNGLTTLGVFLTDISQGDPNIQLDDMNWTTSFQSGLPSTFNIIPGNETNLNNSQSAAPYSYTVTMTFWEFLDDGIGAINEYSAALSIIDGIHDGLLNPLVLTPGTKEDLFFNLDILCQDHDGLNAPGLNLTIVNRTNANSWDNPGPQSLLTDENGEVTFERLKEESYDIVVTYENFGKTLYFDNYTIDPLDVSQSIVIDNLDLTHLDLFLQSTGISQESIIGANVTIYKENATDTELVGEIYSDSFGVASLYWSNLSAAENYTFEVTFLGDPKSINVTGEFAENHTTPVESYTTLVVEVQIEDFYTSLIMESGLVMDSYTFGESFDITVFYYYSISDTSYEIPGASVSYTIPGYALNQPLVTNGTDGYYTATIDSSTLTSDVPLNVYVTASKLGYTPISNTTLLDLQPVPLDLLANTTSVEIDWLESFTIQVYLNDTFNNQLVTDGSVSYAVANNPLLFGDFNQVGNYYELTFDSTMFGSSGSYVINLLGSSDEYSTPMGEIALKINNIQTEINGSILLTDQFDFYVTTSHNYEFIYTSDELGITGADTIYWELEDISDTSFRLGGDLVETTTPGIYEMIGFDSSSLPVGSYSLVVHIGAPNFIERQSAITLNVKQIPIVQTGLEQIYTAPKGEIINISLHLSDPVYNSIISGASVTIFYDGTTYNMTEVGTTGVYYHIVDTEAYKTLARDKIFESFIQISVNENYTIDDIPLTIQIRPPLGPFDVPLIYWLIGGSVAIVALGAFGITKGIQYARIPWIIKQITATRKGIKKKSRFTPSKITRSLDEMVADDAEAAFSILGLSLKGKKPSKGKGKSSIPDAYKDLDEFEGGNE